MAIAYLLHDDILNSLTYDLRSRILDRKRKQARAAFEPLSHDLCSTMTRTMPVIFTFGPIIVLRTMPVIFTFGPTVYYGLCP